MSVLGFPPRFVLHLLTLTSQSLSRREKSRTRLASTALFSGAHMLLTDFNPIDGANTRTVQNKIGQFFTIEYLAWEMYYDPKANKSKKHHVTFGYNIDTGYSCMVSMQMLAELEPSELENWKRRFLLPGGHPTGSSNQPPVDDLSPCDQEGCRCYESRGEVEQLRHENGVYMRDQQDHVPGWRLGHRNLTAQAGAADLIDLSI